MPTTARSFASTTMLHPAARILSPPTPKNSSFSIYEVAPPFPTSLREGADFDVVSDAGAPLLPVFGRSGYPSSCLTSRRSASISCAPYISPEASPAEIKILTWALYRDQSRGCSSLPLVLSLSKGGFRRLGILTLIGSGPSQRLL